MDWFYQTGKRKTNWAGGPGSRDLQVDWGQICLEKKTQKSRSNPGRQPTRWLGQCDERGWAAGGSWEWVPAPEYGWWEGLWREDWVKSHPMRADGALTLAPLSLHSIQQRVQRRFHLPSLAQLLIFQPPRYNSPLFFPIPPNCHSLESLFSQFIWSEFFLNLNWIQ